MIIISEFLPNPAGKDTEGEFIELFNNGGGPVDIGGWKIKDSSNKTFAFTSQKIGAEEYLVLDYKASKIFLNNNGETLFLYDNSGSLVDKAEYAGTAEAGKSLIRRENHPARNAPPASNPVSIAGWPSDAGGFVFTDKPTPGKANAFEVAEAKNSESALSKNYELKSFSSGTNSAFLINNNDFGTGNLAIGLVLALILSIVFVMIYKKINLD